MSIVIKSGVVEGEEAIQNTKNQLVANAISEGIIEVSKIDQGAFSKTIARKDGPLRTAFEFGVRQALAQHIQHTGRTVITWEEIKGFVEAGLDYAQYHFRSRGFYVNPTTPNTFPMRVSRFKPLAVAAVKKHIALNLRNLGLESRTTFSVN